MVNLPVGNLENKMETGLQYKPEEKRYRIYYDLNGITWYSDPLNDYGKIKSLVIWYRKRKYISNVSIIEEVIVRKIIY